MERGPALAPSGASGRTAVVGERKKERAAPFQTAGTRRGEERALLVARQTLGGGPEDGATVSAREASGERASVTGGDGRSITPHGRGPGRDGRQRGAKGRNGGTGVARRCRDGDKGGGERERSSFSRGLGARGARARHARAGWHAAQQGGGTGRGREGEKKKKWARQRLGKEREGKQFEGEAAREREGAKLDFF